MFKKDRIFKSVTNFLKNQGYKFLTCEPSPYVEEIGIYLCEKDNEYHAIFITYSYEKNRPSKLSREEFEDKIIDLFSELNVIEVKGVHLHTLHLFVLNDSRALIRFGEF